jgi:hypothetical protein
MGSAVGEWDGSEGVSVCLTCSVWGGAKGDQQAPEGGMPATARCRGQPAKHPPTHRIDVGWVIWFVFIQGALFMCEFKLQNRVSLFWRRGR